MFFPITDNNPLKIISFQFVTATIIALNVIVYMVMEYAYSEQSELAANYAYGVIPAVLFDQREEFTFALPVAEDLDAALARALIDFSALRCASLRR